MVTTTERLRTTTIIDAPLDPEAIKISAAKLRMSIDVDTGEVLRADIHVTADHDDEEVQRAAERAVVAQALRS